MESLCIVRHSTDKLVVKKKMRATLEFRQNQTSSVSYLYIHDAPGLVSTCAVDFIVFLISEN